MKNLGIYYGATLLDETDLVESKNKNRIILEYYKNKKSSIKILKPKISYGVTIVKKEYEKDRIKLETKEVTQISTNENKVQSIIELLKTYKVTPIALNDVLADLLKQPEFQES